LLGKKISKIHRVLSVYSIAYRDIWPIHFLARVLQNVYEFGEVPSENVSDLVCCTAAVYTTEVEG
jgi:hypothetical protein